MNVIAIIQARMGSTRIPGKIVTNLCGKPMLLHIVERVGKSKYVDGIIVATSRSQADDTVEQLACEYGLRVWRGSEDNVLERFYECAKQYEAEIIIRLTGDNALVDAGIIDMGITYFKEHAYDYIYYREGLPLGMAVEVFTYNALEIAYKNAVDSQCLEHVTPYLYRNPHIFQVKRVPCIGERHDDLRWTMDTEADRKLITEIYKCLYQEKKYFSYEDILKAYEGHPEWRILNSDVEQTKITYQGENKSE